MSSPSTRLLPFAAADGPRNMADDEALLESAVAGIASLRFYTWTSATLSLGYFQNERIRHDDARLAALPFVRRPSGGMTLVHHHELTYALALPAGPPWQTKDEEPWLCRMHHLIARVLAKWGVEARAAVCEHIEASTSVLCFQHLTPGDLVLDAAKVTGSAQRRQRGALLQHGAILLAASSAAPQLPGIQELTGRKPDSRELAKALAAEWVNETGWSLCVVEWSETEAARIEELIHDKYSQASWNYKR